MSEATNLGLPLNSKGQLTWVIPLVFLAVNFFWLTHGQMRAVAAVLLFALLATLMKLNRKIGICLVFGYMILLGDIRRVLSLGMGFPQLDLLLLVAPSVALFISLPIFARFRIRNKLSGWAAALMAVMILEIFNPKQGGITVGLAGAIFYLVPVVWFWIGGKHGTPELLERLLFWVVLPLGFIAALLGILQTFVGFLPWEQAWIATGAMKVTVGGAYRAFGFSVSPTEYGRLLTFAVIVASAGWFTGRKALSILIPPILVAIIFESQRGAVVRLVFAFAVIWALRDVRSNRFVLRFALTLALLFVAVSSIASRFTANPANNTSRTQSLIAHQAVGLAHPLDEKKSTLGLHLGYLGKGLLSGLSNPLGYGLGSTTAATSKIGGENDDSSGFATELDFTDMFESLGIFGGAVYIGFSITALRVALAYLDAAPRRMALSVIGILAANLGNWSISGEYSSSCLIWFLIGATTVLTGGPMLAKKALFGPTFEEIPLKSLSFEPLGEVVSRTGVKTNNRKAK